MTLPAMRVPKEWAVQMKAIPTMFTAWATVKVSRRPRRSESPCEARPPMAATKDKAPKKMPTSKSFSFSSSSM